MSESGPRAHGRSGKWALCRWVGVPHEEVREMQAAVGDKIVVRSHRVGERDREGVVLEVEGPDGSAPYKVRWEDGQEGVFFPGSDTSVEHHPAK